MAGRGRKRRNSRRLFRLSSSSDSTETDGEGAPIAHSAKERLAPRNTSTVQAPISPEEKTESPAPPTNDQREDDGTPPPNLERERPLVSGGSSSPDVSPQDLRQRQQLPIVPELQAHRMPPPGYMQQLPPLHGLGVQRVQNKPGIYHSTEDSRTAHVFPDGRVVYFDRRLKYPGVPGAPYPMHPMHHPHMQRPPRPQVFPPHRAPGVPGGSNTRAEQPLQKPFSQPQLYYPMSMAAQIGQPQHQRQLGTPPPHQSHLVQYVPMRPEQMNQRVPDPKASRISLPGTPIAQTPPPAQRSSSPVPTASAMTPGQPAERMPPSTPNIDLSEQADNDTQRRRRRRTENQHERPASVMEEETLARAQQPAQKPSDQPLFYYPKSIAFQIGQPQHQRQLGTPPPHRSHLVQYVPMRLEQMNQRVPDPRAPRMSLPGTPIAQTQPPAHLRSSPVPTASAIAPSQSAERMPPSTPNKDLSEQTDNDTQKRRRRRTENQHERPASLKEEDPRSARMSLPAAELASNDNETVKRRRRRTEDHHERPSSVIEDTSPASNPNPLPNESTERMELTSPLPPVFVKNPTLPNGDNSINPGFAVDSLNPEFILEYCRREMQTLRLEKDHEILLLKRKITEMEQENKKEIDLMKARYSTILTEKDKFIETLRKNNRGYEKCSSDKIQENISLKNRVKELESEKKGLVDFVEDQRSTAQLKEQELTTEINKLHSERWRQDDEPRLQNSVESSKSNDEKALKIRRLQSQLAKVNDDLDAYKERLSLKEEELKAYRATHPGMASRFQDSPEASRRKQ